ncbi:unnamed protein product [Spirodela intermedia]|uniref:Uncharacterized protein n=1 Tax=Spirodela intermedia TaxID=51605 RepID=A0A7I8JJB6_SPIIN|nr:unnamed protein product [Spirodela intermedia]CAA6669875.1 unnamed protein product [Spirodela intermedia]
MAGPEQTTGMPASMSRVERAHKLYREGMHEEALAFYTEALVMARSKAQRIALHSNRAACYLKLHDFKKNVLSSWLDQQHTGALMLRVQTLVTLKDYQSALFDVNRLIEMSPSSDVYQNLQARLKTQLSQATRAQKPSRIPEYQTTQTQKPRRISESPVTQAQSTANPSNERSKGWETIPKPKGHSGLDYSRWDKVEDDSSEDEEEEDDDEPQYRFRVRTVGM